MHHVLNLYPTVNIIFIVCELCVLYGSETWNDTGQYIFKFSHSIYHTIYMYIICIQTQYRCITKYYSELPVGRIIINNKCTLLHMQLQIKCVVKSCFKTIIFIDISSYKALAALNVYYDRCVEKTSGAIVFNFCHKWILHYCWICIYKHKHI